MIIQVHKKKISFSIHYIYINYFIEKCLSVITGYEIIEVNTTEQSIENNKKTIFQTSR
jgi:hypothetical protein